MFVHKWKHSLLLLLILLLSIPPVVVQSADRDPVHVLLLYDSQSIGTSREGNIEALGRMLASFSAKVTLTSMDSYKQGTLRLYTKVIAVRNAEDLNDTPPDLLKDLAAYEGDYLHIGEHLPVHVQEKLNIQTRKTGKETIRLSIGPFSQPLIRVNNMPYMVQHNGVEYGSLSSENGEFRSPFAVREGRYTYIPYLEKGNLSELAISYVLKDWFAVAAPSHTYVLFKEIYPFSDLKMLERLSDKLYDAGIPFAVSVSPVFGNTEYPAAQRYLETLKYVQSHNGSILVHAPVVASTSSQEGGNTLKPKMTSFLKVLIDYGIAPLGMGAEMYWSYDTEYVAAGMSYFDSVVLFPNKQLMYRAQTNSSQPFASALYSLPLDVLQQYEHTGRAVQAFPMHTAITVDMYENETELEQAVQRLKQSWLTFADYKNEPHQVQTEASIRSASRDGQLLIKGQNVDLNDVRKDISSEHSYVQQEEKSFSKLFNVQNTIFIIIIVLTLVIFGFLFIIGYRLYKRKYYK